ncbi:MAG: hypothetical protein JXR78_10550 [Victivallales bacterium]|nr:hypothetical protein [Victivallales bacterium]
MLRSWEKRSPEVAALLNPAFTSLLVCKALLEFKKDDECEAPYALPFILLPLILHPQTRLKLPRSSRTAFSAWITKEETAAIKVGFAGRAKNMAPYVKDALLFSLKNNRLSINSNGMIVIPSDTKLSVPNSTAEVIDCVRAAKLCGKWFSTIGDLKTAMALLGVQP